MKKLILLALISLGTYTASAQTNIQLRVQVDGVNSTLNLDMTGSKKDQNRIAGLVYAYGVYTNALGTNGVPLALGDWLKNQHIVLIDDYSRQKQAADNATVAAKIQILLTTQSDLLSAAQKSQLAAIAALIP